MIEQKKKLCRQIRPMVVLKLSGEHSVRKNIRPVLLVDIVEKHNQRSGLITTGEVKDIFNSWPNSSQGNQGQIGRVQKVIVP